MSPRIGPADQAATPVTPDEGEGTWPATVNLGPLVSDVRRRWRTLASLSIIGAVLALLLLSITGSGATATTTMLLARGASEDEATAISTDVGLLRTRALAEKVIASEGLDESADNFLSRVTVETPSALLMTLTVAGSNPFEATAHASAVATAFLDFRADVLRQQVDASVRERESRAAKLEEELTLVTAEIEQISSSEGQSQNRLDNLISARSDLTSEIESLREASQSEQVSLAAVIQSSRVIDPAAVNTGRGTREALFTVISGGIGGVALALGLVIVQSLVSDRPRARSEIARALATPVLISTDRVSGRRPTARRAREQIASRILADIASGQLPPSGLALLGIACERESVVVAVALIRALEASGAGVAAVDLTESGRLKNCLRSKHREAPGAEETATVSRPARVPTVARRPDSLKDPDASFSRRSNSSAEKRFVLVVGEATPAVGADHIATWTDTAVLLVKPGGVSHQRLVSSANAVRLAGIALAGALLTGMDRTDDSLGEPPIMIESSALPSRGPVLSEK